MPGGQGIIDTSPNSECYETKGTDHPLTAGWRATMAITLNLCMHYDAESTDKYTMFLGCGVGKNLCGDSGKGLTTTSVA